MTDGKCITWSHAILMMDVNITNTMETITHFPMLSRKTNGTSCHELTLVHLYISFVPSLKNISCVLPIDIARWVKLKRDIRVPAIISNTYTNIAG